MNEMATRYAQALDAFIKKGCNDSQDIADVLAISKPYASLLVSELARDGLIRRTGRRRLRNTNNAMTPFVYEVAIKN